MWVKITCYNSVQCPRIITGKNYHRIGKKKFNFRLLILRFTKTRLYKSKLLKSSGFDQIVVYILGSTGKF